MCWWCSIDNASRFQDLSVRILRDLAAITERSLSFHDSLSTVYVPSLSTPSRTPVHHDSCKIITNCAQRSFRQGSAVQSHNVICRCDFSLSVCPVLVVSSFSHSIIAVKPFVQYINERSGHHYTLSEWLARSREQRGSWLWTTLCHSVGSPETVLVNLERQSGHVRSMMHYSIHYRSLIIFVLIIGAAQPPHLNPHDPCCAHCQVLLGH